MLKVDSYNRNTCFHLQFYCILKPHNLTDVNWSYIEEIPTIAAEYKHQNTYKKLILGIETSVSTCSILKPHNLTDVNWSYIEEIPTIAAEYVQTPALFSFSSQRQ